MPLPSVVGLGRSHGMGGVVPRMWWCANIIPKDDGKCIVFLEVKFAFVLSAAFNTFGPTFQEIVIAVQEK